MSHTRRFRRYRLPTRLEASLRVALHGDSPERADDGLRLDRRLDGRRPTQPPDSATVLVALLRQRGWQPRQAAALVGWLTGRAWRETWSGCGRPSASERQRYGRRLRYRFAALDRAGRHDEVVRPGRPCRCQAC